MSVFFRLIQHLLPRAEAWRLPFGSTIRKYFQGLGDSFDPAKAYVDQVWEDQFAATTRELADAELELGIVPPTGATISQRRATLARWRARHGGQSPAYIQSVLDAEGFSQVRLHEWWSSGPPYVARDPRAYTETPLIGQYQCAGYDSMGDPESFQHQCSELRDLQGNPLDQPQCSEILLNDPGYLVNLDLTERAPPPVPDDPKYWPFFLYFCASTFGDPAIVTADDLPELKRLLLKLCPTQCWIVLITAPTDPGNSFFYFAAPSDSGNGFNNDPWRTYS